MAVNIYGEPLEAPIPKKVLLFSGGMDSWIAACLWKPDILLYCPIGSVYEISEIKAIQRLLPYLPESHQHIQMKVDRRLNLGDQERKDGIIPLRNLYFVMMATRYGDRIGMGVLDGEVNGDKSHEFARTTESLLNICYRPSYWSEGREIKIEYPISMYSKAEAIKAYLEQGFPEEALKKTISCYSGGEVHCGKCSNCVKRYIAMRLNGIEEEYEQDPRTSPMIQEYVRRMPTFNKKRQSEIMEVLFNGK